VYMALENIVGVSSVQRRWMIAFGFGLVHGFGFSFALRQTLQFAGSHLLSSLLSALVNQGAGYVSAGVVPHRMGNRHPSIAPYEVYATADNQIVLAVGNDRQFVALCGALSIPDVANDVRFGTNTARVHNREPLNELLTQALAARDAADWFDVLSAVGVPCGPINDVAAAFELAQRLGLEPIVEIVGASSADRGQAGHSSVQQHAANPITLSSTPATYRIAAPVLGSDSDSIRASLLLPDS